MENWRNLLTVKSLVTLFLTVVFGVLLFRGGVTQEFMVIYTVVIGFYFGTQSNKSKATATATATSGDTAATEEADTDAV